MFRLSHHLDDTQHENVRRALCCGRTALIRGGDPLTQYLDLKCGAWPREAALEDLPASFRVPEGQLEVLAPVWSGQWTPRHLLDRFAANPQVNKHTGDLDAALFLRGSPGAVVEGTVRKLEVVPLDMWRRQAQPIHSRALRAQLRALRPGAADAQDAAQDADTEAEQAVIRVYDSTHNRAHLCVLAHLCFEYLRENRLVPGVPIYYWSGQTVDHHFFKGAERQFNPIPVNLLVHEKLGATMKDSWLNDGFLDGRRVLADLFQVVFNLALLQLHMGFVHGSLDLCNWRARREEPEARLYCQWGSRYYCVPTYGRVWKLVDLQTPSFVFRGQRLVSLEMQDLLQQTLIPYQKDLVTFARQARAILAQELLDDAAQEPLKCALLALLQRWTTCWAVSCADADAVDPVSRAAGGPASDLVRLETAVCRDRDSQECKDYLFRQTGAPHTVCSNAIPYLQQRDFALFEIAAADVPPRQTVYRLLVGDM